MKKRNKAQSNTISLILIIIIILILVVILWNLIFGMLNKKAEPIELEVEMMNTGIGISDLNGDAIHNVTLSLHRGPEIMKVVNETIIYIEVPSGNIVNASIISAIDRSGSMGADWYPGECKINKGSSCCLAENCSTSSGCSNCLGNFINNECYLYSISSNPCCRNNDCYSQLGCEGCGGTWAIMWNDLLYCSGKPGCMDNKGSCLGCNGIWRTKLDVTKEANNIFIDNIFNINSNNEIGLVAFYDVVDSSSIQPLTKDPFLLKNKINSLSGGGSTNMCLGLNKSIELLNASKTSIKIIVIMTDGFPCTFCNGTEFCNAQPFGSESFTLAKEEVINMAKLANLSNISVYTIGLGPAVDSVFLETVASAANGTFSKSGVSGLEKIYSSISEDIKEKIEVITRDYEAVQKWNHLNVVFYNDTNTYIYPIYDVPQPLETKDYVIPAGLELSKYITHVKKVEIYMVAYTKDGREVLSRMLDSWIVKKVG